MAGHHMVIISSHRGGELPLACDILTFYDVNHLAHTFIQRTKLFVCFVLFNDTEIKNMLTFLFLSFDSVMKYEVLVKMELLNVNNRENLSLLAGCCLPAAF